MLNNTAYKIKHEKSLRVAYFGGSITEGSGASATDATSYRALVTSHLRTCYPDAEITEINAAIGGTGTGLGMFRLKQDVLSHSPDLVFIEFAVNDFGDGCERISLQTESIVRQIRRHSPDTDTVMLFTTSEEAANVLDNGGKFTSREAQRVVAEHYGIPCVDLGESLRAHIAKTGEPYVKYAPDTLHPNDAGYRIFADTLAHFLTDALVNCPCSLSAHKLPEKLHESCRDYADIIPIDELDELSLKGFTVKDEHFDRFTSYVVSSERDGEIYFSFKGTGLVICRLDGSTSPELFVQIDGKEEIKLGDPNKVVRSFEKLAALTVTHSLDEACHRVKIRAVSTPGSLVIGGIYVCSDKA